MNEEMLRARLAATGCIDWELSMTKTMSASLLKFACSPSDPEILDSRCSPPAQEVAREQAAGHQGLRSGRILTGHVDPAATAYIFLTSELMVLNVVVTWCWIRIPFF